MASHFGIRLLGLAALRSLTEQDLSDLRTIRRYELETSQFSQALTE